jgi:hypothetical protein
MADDFDRAQEREAKYREDALKAQAESAKHSKLMPCHVCHNCDAIIGDGLFCDRDCRDDYDHRLKIKQRTRG